MKRYKKIINKGEYDMDVARHTLGILDLMFQRMTEHVATKEQPAHISYKDLENLKFQIMLT